MKKAVQRGEHINQNYWEHMMAVRVLTKSEFHHPKQSLNHSTDKMPSQKIM